VEKDFSLPALMQINTDYRSRFANGSTTAVSELSSKKTVNKITENIKINSLDDDSASLSINEDHLAKKYFFEILMSLDDGINIISTVLFNLNSVQDIVSALGKPHTDTNSLINEIENIKNQSEFNSQKLLDGRFLKDIKLWKKDNSSFIIDFRNPENGGQSESSVDFNIKDTSSEGNLVSGLTVSLKELAINKNPDDFSQLNNNIQRMEEHALKLKATILDYYKQLEAIIKNLSTKSNFSDVKVNLFLNGIKKEFTEKSAMSMLMQVSENHASALSLLP
jgi:flagellin-like hook-associated protein FlgL